MASLSRGVDAMDSWVIGRPNRRRFRNPAPLQGNFLLKLFSGQSGNYCVIATLVAFVVVSYLTSQYHHKDQELENIKKFLKVMEPIEFQVADQVDKACMTLRLNVCYLQRPRQSIGTETDTPPSDKLNIKKTSALRQLVIPRNSSSSQEVTLMSYVYTSSFDKVKNKFNKTEV